MKASHRKDVIIARIIFAINLRSTARRNYITYRMASWAECREKPDTGNGNHK